MYHPKTQSMCWWFSRYVSLICTNGIHTRCFISFSFFFFSPSIVFKIYLHHSQLPGIAWEASRHLIIYPPPPPPTVMNEVLVITRFYHKQRCEEQLHPAPLGTWIRGVGQQIGVCLAPRPDSSMEHPP